MSKHTLQLLKAAQALGLDSLPAQLSAKQISRLWGEPLLEKMLQTDANAKVLPCVWKLAVISEGLQPRLLGFFEVGSIYSWGSSSFEVRRGNGLRAGNCAVGCPPERSPQPFFAAENFAAWANLPPIPEGAAGELVRAWLSLATGESAAASVPVEDKAKRRRATREDALHRFIAEAVDEWRETHRGARPLPADVLRLLRRDYPTGSECGIVVRVTEDGIEWRPPTATASKFHGGEALRKRLERMRPRNRCNAQQSRTDDMDDCA